MACQTDSFSSEDFFADVINAVNDLHIDGFNSLEDHISQQLNLSPEEEQTQLKEAVDAIFVKVQTTVDKNLQQWERYCLSNCFFVPERVVAAEKEEVEIKPETDAADIAKQTELDTQMDAIRTRILTVRRDCSKLIKESQMLEAWLSCKRAKVDAVTRAGSLLDDRKLSVIEAEISKSSARLLERMRNAETETLELKVDKRSKTAFAKCLNEVL